MKPIRVAIVGTGGMARAHANNFKNIRGCCLAAACDIDRGRVEQFGKDYGITACYTDFARLLRDVEVDAVSIVSTDATHKPLALLALAARKHVLCEKPLATGYADARRMADAAKRAGVINMVNFSYRNSSAIHRCAEWIRKGRIGRVMHFEASYLQSWLVSTAWGDWHTSPNWLWRLSTGHGSNGVLGDVGVHILDFAGYPIGEFKSVDCRLRTFDKAPGGRIGEYVLDANDSAAMTVEMAGGALGVIHTTRWATGHNNSLRLCVYGDEGSIRVELDKAWDRMEVCLGKNVHKAEWKTVQCGRTPNLWQRFIRGVRTGVNDQPDFARGAAVQKVLDACKKSDSIGGIVKV